LVLSSVIFLEFKMTFERPVILFLRFVAIYALPLCSLLTHIVNLNKVMTIMTVIYTLNANCKRTGLTKIFHWLIFMQIARNKVRQFHRARLSNECKYFMIRLKIFICSLSSNCSLA
jgi:hypothetical protein